jgi:hypothetical protein
LAYWFHINWFWLAGALPEESRHVACCRCRRSTSFAALWGAVWLGGSCHGTWALYKEVLLARLRDSEKKGKLMMRGKKN